MLTVENTYQSTLTEISSIFKVAPLSVKKTLKKFRPIGQTLIVIFFGISHPKYLKIGFRGLHFFEGDSHKCKIFGLSSE